MMKSPLFIFLLILLMGASCKRDSSPETNAFLEQYFETNVLNTNFTVSLATNNGTDITSDYTGYVFVLLKTDFFHGPLQATKNGTTINGTWSCNDDYSKLTIILPSPPAEFAFLNRAWKFTSKNFPTLALAPWGSSEALVLHMLRQ